MISQFDLSAGSTVAAEVPGGAEPPSRHEGRELIGKLPEIDDMVRPVRASRSKVAARIGRGLRNPAGNRPRQARRVIRVIAAGAPLVRAENWAGPCWCGEPAAGMQLQ